MWKRIDIYIQGGPKWESWVIVLPEAPKDRFFIEILLNVSNILSKTLPLRGFGIWIYGELHTGGAWNLWQSVIPKESTVHPVILAADATHVTNISGDGKVHPVYVSSSNISTEICY